jgi:hypothetical protein
VARRFGRLRSAQERVGAAPESAHQASRCAAHPSACVRLGDLLLRRLETWRGNEEAAWVGPHWTYPHTASIALTRYAEPSCDGPLRPPRYGHRALGSSVRAGIGRRHRACRSIATVTRLGGYQVSHSIGERMVYCPISPLANQERSIRTGRASGQGRAPRASRAPSAPR